MVIDDSLDPYARLALAVIASGINENDTAFLNGKMYEFYKDLVLASNTRDTTNIYSLKSGHRLQQEDI